MKKISKRAWMALALAAALLAGLLVFFGEYFIEAKTWVAFPGSPHVYTGVNPDCGKIYDRSGMLLLNTNDGRVYNADEAVRRATLHLLGDRDGYISAPLLQTYASKMIGFDVVNGLYTDEPGSVAARLTISAAVQSAAQQALSGYRGTIGVYNYKTGEILCAVTSPSYDPDHVPDVANDTTGSYEGVYVNRFFDAAYTPGSIFKLVTAAAALETIEGVQSRTFQCSGKTIIGGQEIICNGVHGSLDLAGALAHSCNVAFGELAAELGAQTLQEYAEKLGLTGSISCEGYKTAPGKIDLSGADDGDVAWAGIGQSPDQVGAAERVVRLEKRSRDILAVFCNRHTENVPCGIELSRKRRVCRQLGGSQEKRAAKIGLFQKRGVICHRFRVRESKIDGGGHLLGLVLLGLIRLLLRGRLRLGGLGGIHLVDAVLNQALCLFHEQAVVIDLTAGCKAEDGVAGRTLQQAYLEREERCAVDQRDIEHAAAEGGRDSFDVAVLIGDSAFGKIEDEAPLAREQNERLRLRVVCRNYPAGRGVERRVGHVDAGRGFIGKRRKRQRNRVVDGDK